MAEPDPASKYDWERNLVNHAPSDDCQLRMEALRDDIHVLAKAMDHDLPPGREKALAFTRLEELTMWAMASLARMDWDLRGRPK